MEFWKSVIFELEEQGYDWEVFTNGLYQDYQFAIEILHYAGIEEWENHIVKRPVEGIELAEIISNYQGVIACRLHANIIAFSEGVPSIGLVWNEKMKQWGERIGYAERFIDAENIRADAVLKALYNAIEEGCRQCTDLEREGILLPLTEFCKKYGVPCMKAERKKNFNFSEILVARAMGGKNWQYYGMNSGDTISSAYKSGGFRWFEADLKLTSDNVIVELSIFCIYSHP